MKISLVSEGPAPWRSGTRKIYNYRFKISSNLKLKQNEIVKESIEKCIRKDKINKFQ